MDTALITGASRGLGLALARELARRSWRLVIDARGADALEDARAELARRTEVVAVPGDVADPEHRRALAAAADPERLRAELIEDYTRRLMHPHYSAERGLVDDVIDPVLTRAAVARGLAMLRTKRKNAPQRKHGNVPL
jgi:NAD(P)-dependent dehydrogenase (short-subunit alcohol dehydrogenase family)